MRNKLFRIFAVIFVLFLSVETYATECVEYARNRSGIQIRGDAWTWWDKASGTYEAGSIPKVGSVIVFKKTSPPPVGHVAFVSSIISRSEILVDHANWSPTGKRDGKTYSNIKIVDVSGNWTRVKVYGNKPYDTYGFIYPNNKSTQDRLPSYGSIIKPNTYHIRITNIDDDGVCFVNGQQVASAGYHGDTGWVDISQYLRRGNNSIEFKVKNNKGGYAYYFGFKENGKVEWEKQCGKVGEKSCKEHLSKGNVLSKKFTWKM